MEFEFPNNKEELINIHNRLFYEFLKSNYKVELCIRNYTEDIIVSLLHYNKGYEHNNKSITFYPFSSLEKLKEQEQIAMEVLKNNKLIEQEF